MPDTSLPEVGRLLAELVQRQSVTPDDAGCQALLAAELEPLGFRCESMPFADVSNLWARRGTEGPLFCFAGHTDVVPPGDLALWETDPFTAVVRDGQLYGRGAADMKGSIAAFLSALRRFLARHPNPRGSIALLITSDEEGPAQNGTRKVIDRLSERGESIDWCLVGEPSSHERLGDVVRIGRRGSLSGSVTVRGVQGHVAYPELADNAIHRFAPVLSELSNTRWDDGNEHFPPTSFQVVSLESRGAAINVVPGELTARFNFRYSTRWTHETLKAKVNALFARHELDYDIAWHLSGEPFLTAPGALIDAACQVIRSATGAAPQLSTGGGTSDGRFIAPIGADVIELGPINASIHKVNEHVSLADLETLAGLYESMLETMLTEAGST